MPVRLNAVVPVALFTALALTAAQPAHAAARARTVTAVVVAPPAPGKGGATLPVLLSRRGAHVYRRAVLAVTLRGARPIHWGSDRMRLAKLRPGDRLTLTLRGTRVQRAQLRMSGPGDSFDAVDARLARAGRDGQTTVAYARPIAQAQAESAFDAGALRALRAQLDPFLDDLLALSDDLDLTLRKLVRERPADLARRAAVAAAQKPYVDRLTSVRDQARAVIAATKAAAEELDPLVGEIGDVTGPQPPTLPVDAVGSASSLLDAVTKLLDALGLPPATEAPPVTGLPGL